jgi:hypothetical protein
MVILTDHAVLRIKQRDVPDPRYIKIKKVTPKVMKEKGLSRVLNDKVGYTFADGRSLFLYVCQMKGDDIIVITAYKYERIYVKPKGRHTK